MFRTNNQMPGKCILSGTPSPIYLQVFPQFSFEVGLARKSLDKLYETYPLLLKN